MITVFGSINLDLVVAVPRLPRAGETVSGPDHQMFPGGKGANQALAARRAGSAVTMISAVGQDAFADLALRNLRQADVDLSGIRSLPGTTGIALIGIDPAGENQIIVASGTNARVDAEWLSEVLIPNGILLLQGEIPFTENVTSMQMAKAEGSRVIWNPAPVPEGNLRDALEATDVLVVNESEAALIAASLGLAGEPEAFLAHFASDGHVAVVTQGSQGIVADDGNGPVRIGAPKIEAVDTTGAGDAFCGALASALDRNIPFPRALREGIAAGALACTVTGAQTSAPHHEDIMRLADQIL
ncbi:Ribokinase [Labrenzia sp. THAF82]|uniref:ribokinase n=1 Tax=Labrenzia sp. THAF82 TaxID=2587861 RepID=UPI001267FBF2|nr:ribokinase [Labrenzia sp. THAF82]QFT34269.1 Ribokinase [Labrenzia sp. THAF82]